MYKPTQNPTQTSLCVKAQMKYTVQSHVQGQALQYFVCLFWSDSLPLLASHQQGFDVIHNATGFVRYLKVQIGPTENWIKITVILGSLYICY